ncbi:hypothetical protein Cgig2_022340 [Carnegiea gigantea]|uniref:Uncharacterized protein n=1 Tax=Carnegiea gigantea TaxID=171969 RepID=A0A9Q1KGR9_9CARY|nr:hypothetical protein Cgig2_022340 [Carnegiea gigantea]
MVTLAPLSSLSSSSTSSIHFSHSIHKIYSFLIWDSSSSLKLSPQTKKFSIQCSEKPSITLKTCKNCKTQFDPTLNHPRACRFHTAHFGGNFTTSFSVPPPSPSDYDVELTDYKCIRETKRKFESVYEGGTMNTPNSGQVFQYWHCCGSEDPFDPGCTYSPHLSYDD